MHPTHHTSTTLKINTRHLMDSVVSITYPLSLDSSPFYLTIPTPFRNKISSSYCSPHNRGPLGPRPWPLRLFTVVEIRICTPFIFHRIPHPHTNTSPVSSGDTITNTPEYPQTSPKGPSNPSNLLQPISNCFRGKGYQNGESRNLRN